MVQRSVIFSILIKYLLHRKVIDNLNNKITIRGIVFTNRTKVLNEVLEMKQN